MAKPNLKFKNADDPYKIRGGERRILTMEVKARALGKCKLTLFLKAATCSFVDGSKKIVVEFDVADISDKREFDIQLSMIGTRKINYSLNLNAKVENADGDKNDDFLLIKLDCRNPMKEEEQTVTFEEAPLTEATPPVEEEEVVVIEEKEEPILEDTEENESAEEEIETDTDTSTEEDADENP